MLKNTISSNFQTLIALEAINKRLNTESRLGPRTHLDLFTETVDKYGVDSYYAGKILKE